MERIRDFMTPQPWTVQIDDSVALARSMFAEREIHHLPVLDGGEVVGIVTDRAPASVHDRAATLDEVVAPVRCVASDAALDEVLDEMSAHHWDAVVTGHDGVHEAPAPTSVMITSSSG